MISLKSQFGIQRKFWISAAAFCILFLRPVQSSYLLAPIVIGSVAWGASRSEAFYLAANQKDKKTAGVSFLISCLSAFLYAAIWLRTRRLVSLRFFDKEKAIPYLAAAVVCGLLSVYFVYTILRILRISHKEKGRNLDCLEFRREKTWVFLMAAISITVCSTSSPVYPLNDWVDTNCFFTVGKSMLYGKIPYRDLYEQKGPLLYMLYSLAYPISHTSFLGVWLLEIVAAYSFLRLAYRLFLQLTGRKSLLSVLLTAVLTYTSPAFLKGGSAEEFCLPLLMTAFCIGSDAVRNERKLSKKECILIGLTSGAVFWIKYSLAGFYLGFILVPAWMMIRNKETGALVRAVLLIIGGVALISGPILIYFYANNALGDLWNAYFFNNIHVYGKSTGISALIKALLSGMASMITYNDAVLILMAMALCALILRKRKEEFLFLLLSFCFSFLLIYAGGRNMKYYSEILCMFIPACLAELWIITRSVLQKDLLLPGLKKWVLPVLLVASLFGTENNYLLKYQKTDMPQYVFAEMISETPGATLFNYGALDLGLYTVCDIIPSCRYFCMLNLPSDEMFQEMDRYMSEGVTDFIVSRGITVESTHYELIAQMSFQDSGTVYPYYLYKNTELKSSYS